MFFSGFECFVVVAKASPVFWCFWRTIEKNIFSRFLIKTNYIRFTPTKEGTYDGKCAELCGEYHSEMLFRVKVVSEAEFEAHMDELRESGNTGLLGEEYDRNPNLNEIK